MPKFKARSSGIATMAGMEYVPFTVGSCGASKAAPSSWAPRIHCENKGLITFAVHPGD